MSDLDDTDYTGRIAYIEQEIQKTQEINDLLHQQNELRDRIINQNVAELRGKGFQVDYNDSINYLEIQNMEHLNELKGANQQATNELVQETEDLISATIELNDANKDNSASWQDNASAIKGYTKEIGKLREEMFDSFLSKWDKFFSVHKDFNLFGPAEEIKRKKELLKEIVEWYEKGIISEEKYTEAYNDTAKDIYNIQLDSLEEILDMVEKMLRQESEDMVDALEGQKDRYRDIIDLKKQSLRLTDQELSYNREIDDKVREIAKLQARIDQLSLDDSREAGAERAALLDELAKLQAELAEFQNDHSLELQEDALDKEYDNFEQNIDKEIDAVEAGMNDAAGMHPARDRIHQRALGYPVLRTHRVELHLRHWHRKRCKRRVGQRFDISGSLSGRLSARSKGFFTRAGCSDRNASQDSGKARLCNCKRRGYRR